VEFLDRQVPIAFGEKQVTERDALARRTKAGVSQPCLNGKRGLCHHPTNSGLI
jgi:hypothetical protein